MPFTYRHATDEFRRFIGNARLALNLDSDNMAYTAVDGVFRTFRRRLTAQQAIDFANQLPTVLRAIFVQDWQIGAQPAEFADRAHMTDEAKALRRDHNLTPDNAIAAVAWALRQEVRKADFDRVLRAISPAAEAFWTVPEGFGEDL